MAACRCGWSPAGGSNSLPEGSVHEGRGALQLHDVRGKVQHARLIVAVQRCAMCELPRWSAHLNLKGINLENNKKQVSLSGEHGFPGQG